MSKGGALRKEAPQLNSNHREVGEHRVFDLRFERGILVGKNNRRAGKQAANENGKATHMVQWQREQPRATRLKRNPRGGSRGIGNVGLQIMPHGARRAARTGSEKHRPCRSRCYRRPTEGQPPQPLGFPESPGSNGLRPTERFGFRQSRAQGRDQTILGQQGQQKRGMVEIRSGPCGKGTVFFQVPTLQAGR